MAQQQSLMESRAASQGFNRLVESRVGARDDQQPSDAFAAERTIAYTRPSGGPSLESSVKLQAALSVPGRTLQQDKTSLLPPRQQPDDPGVGKWLRMTLPPVAGMGKLELPLQSEVKTGELARASDIMQLDVGPRNLSSLSPDQIGKLIGNPDYKKLFQHDVLSTSVSFQNSVKREENMLPDRSSRTTEMFADGGVRRTLSDQYGRPVLQDNRKGDKWQSTVQTAYADTPEGKPRPWVASQMVASADGSMTITQFDKFGRPQDPVQAKLKLDAIGVV